MLKYIITSKAKRSLLKLLLTNPDNEFYIREISRRTGEPLNAVRRELGYLEKAGLVKARHAGNLKYYSVVKEFPFYPELKRIIYTTVGLGDYLANKFKDSKQIELAFVYGSVAKDEETAKSDVDLFVVGEIDEDDLHELISRVEKDIGRVINYTLMSRAEFEKRLKNNNSFIKRVMDEKKLVLKGNHDVN
ncbi:MAG: nucleotidyltransferase domain-containing protein [Dehalococcoidales bacterium]|nr:nucleotidyltransferase domain-containing protein [Dehalococcoidales bacterium]